MLPWQICKRMQFPLQVLQDAQIEATSNPKVMSLQPRYADPKLIYSASQQDFLVQAQPHANDGYAASHSEPAFTQPAWSMDRVSSYLPAKP